MRTIDYETLRQKTDREDDFLLINVLSEDEYKKDHIEGSINIPVEEEDFVNQVEKKAGSKNFDIVTYCASYDCPASGDAARKLTQAGFTNVRAYEGGMKEWNERNKKPKAA